jgi:hypothetical protein
MSAEAKDGDLKGLSLEMSPEAEAMLAELEGRSIDASQVGGSPEWPERFLAAGTKPAPSWPARFTASGMKSAPSRPTRFIASGDKVAPNR